MSPAEIEVKINLARREMEWWQQILASRQCTTCQHCSAKGWCDKFKTAPPEEVQKTGCDEWSWDSIPF